MVRTAASNSATVRARLAPLALCLAAVPLFTAGCVTTYTPIDLVDQTSQLPASQPVAIPIPQGAGQANRLLLEFYSGILRRLQDAADDGDVALLDSLVESYDKPNIPDSVSQHLAGYRAIGRGIRFRQHAAKTATIELRDPAADAAPANGAAANGVQQPAQEGERKVPALGKALHLNLRLPSMDHTVVLGGRNDRNPLGFSVSVTVEDEYVDGSSRSLHTDGVVWLPERFELVGDQELMLPIDVGAAQGDAVRRNITVRVDMRGHVEIDEVRAPVQSTSIAAASYTQWPTGYDILKKQGLAALKVALAAFQPKNFPSVYLASMNIPAEHQGEATELLMDQVRFGRADQAQVAMAALQKVTGLSIAVGDRASWLEWWQGRAAGRAAGQKAKQPSK